MKTLVSVFALVVALAFTAPAVAGTGGTGGAPTMKSSCEKAKMKWDNKAQKCCASMSASGHCM